MDNSRTKTIKKRITFLMPVDYAAGGLQRSTMAAARCLQGAGHDVTILCLYLLADGFAKDHDFVLGLGGEENYGNSSPLYLLWKLRRYILARRPDVCIGMGLSTSVMLRLVTTGLAWTRVYGSERAYPPMLEMSRKWRLLRALTLPRLAGLICQTQRTAAYYHEDMGIASDRLIVIPNVIAPPLEPLPVLSTAFAAFAHSELVACVGRHDWQKGFDMALLVFASISRVRPQARFILIGEGSLEATHREEACRLGLADKILFLPRFDHLAEIWPKVDVFLLTSRYEGIPNVLAEAMSYGRACVSFDCPTGPAELIRDGLDGFLVEAGNIELAAERCIELLRDVPLRCRMGDAARAVADRFSHEKICGLWGALVDSQVHHSLAD